MELLLSIKQKLRKEADRRFDPEEAMDSDGYDQGVREGLLTAIDIVEGEFHRHGNSHTESD